MFLSKFDYITGLSNRHLVSLFDVDCKVLTGTLNCIIINIPVKLITIF